MEPFAETRMQFDLGGTWEIAFDPNAEGLRLGWATGAWPIAQATTTRVPGVWNIDHPLADGVGFYRRLFKNPSGALDQAVVLHCEGASYRTEAWLNGHYLGSHEGAYTPFSFELSPFLKSEDDNELILRVAGLSRTRPIDGMVLAQMPASKQSWYYAYGGVWGRVYLEVRPLVACQAVWVDPDLRNERIQAQVLIHNRQPESRLGTLKLAVQGADGATIAQYEARAAVGPGVDSLLFTLPIPHPQPWSCDHPYLYNLQVTLEVEGRIDRQTITFGMRDFTVENGQFFLNGQPIFLRGVLLQPNYPITLVTPPDSDMLYRELTLIKEAGFNLVRTHLRPAPPGYLDLADRLGLLVYAETSLAWIKDSPRLMAHGQREVEALIQRDRNHPSVVFWGIYNENPTASAINSEALLRFTRALDPTRVIVDDSGGSLAIDQDFGWIDRASVVANRQTERQRIIDLHLYLGGFIPNAVYDWLHKLGTSVSANALVEQDFGSPAIARELDRELRSYDGQIFVSELGCAGMMDLDEAMAGFGERRDLLDAREIGTFRDGLRQGFEERGLDRLFGSLPGLVNAAQALQAAGNTRQIEALLTNPRISGYLITQLNDVAYEFHAGLLDLWRKPKLAYQAAKRLNAPYICVLKASHITALTGETVTISVSLVSQTQLPAGLSLSIVVRDPDGNPVLQTQRTVSAQTGIQVLEAVVVKVGPTPGSYTIQAQLALDAGDLISAAETVWVFVPLAWPKVIGPLAWVGAMPEIANQMAEGQTPDSSLMVAADPSTVLESEWERVLAKVKAGGVAVIGPLHSRDVLAQRMLTQQGLPIRLHLATGSWLGCYHILSNPDLFAGLPTSGLAGRPFADVHPWYSLSELGGAVLAQALSNTQTRKEPPAILWLSDVEAVPLGKGHLIFCQYRIFAQAHQQPVAAQLLSNLLRLARQYLNPS